MESCTLRGKHETLDSGSIYHKTYYENYRYWSVVVTFQYGSHVKLIIRQINKKIPIVVCHNLIGIVVQRFIGMVEMINTDELIDQIYPDGGNQQDI